MEKNQGNKILYLVTQSEWGGAQTYIFDLAFYFSHNGWQVCVAAGEDKEGELLKRLEKTGIITLYLSHLRRKISVYNDIRAFYDIWRLCRQIKPDIVHLNSSKAGAIGAIAAKLAGVKKVIYTVHGLVLNEPLSLFKKTFYSLAEKISAKFKNILICVSEYDKQSVLKHKICKEKKIKVIYNGIGLKNIKFLDEKEAKQELCEKLLGWCNDSDPLIGSIAHLYNNKGLVYLVEAAREAIKLKPDLKFIIIGEGEEREKLEKLIKDCRLENNFMLAGNIFRASQYLKAFDMYVLPSVKEGLSYSLIEAQAAQIPTITTRVGGNPEIVMDKKTGILIPAKDFTQLATNIVNLVQDKKRQEEFSKNSKENVVKFDLERMIKETTQIYMS